MKIRVPFFIDDPLIGRFIAFIPIPIFFDQITIENRQLLYTGSKLSTKRNKSFNLETIEKFILVKTNVTPWTHDHKLDPYGLIGTAIELYLAAKNGEKHILIPKFIMNVNNWGLRRWNRFLSELTAQSGLPLEEINIQSKRNN